MAKYDELLERIEKLESRNKRVEGNKARETSWIRRLSISRLKSHWLDRNS